MKNLIIRKKFSYKIELFQNCKYFDNDKVMETLEPYTTNRKETQKKYCFRCQFKFK